MQFLNPLALAGLAATLIPLAVHLLHRGKPRVVPFSNVAFLRELHQSRMRSVRLRQWLVLLLRMLAVACLALAFARPALQDGGGFLGGSRPTSAALLLDHSYSTRYAPPGGRLFDRLRQRADEVLTLFDGRDRVFVVPFSSRPDTVGAAVGVDAWRERIADRGPGEAGTDVARALRSARERLAESPGSLGEIYLFTDRARVGWDGVSPGTSDLGDHSVFVVTPSAENRRNLYVADHHFASWLAAPGSRMTLSARVGQSGGEEVRVSVDLFVDGERVQRRQVLVPPSGTSTVDFTMAPRRSGRLTGFIQVETDEMPIDNRRHFTLHVPERIAVVLAGPQRSDTYYARRGLTAAATGDAALEVESISLTQLDEEVLASTDVLVLCNVVDLAAETTRALRRFAEAGGGVLVLPGPRADLTRFNRELLPGLVPATIAGILGHPGGEGYVGLDTARVDAGLFADLLVEADDRPRFHAVFEIASERQLAVLARFDDGHPALVEGHPGDGRVLLWAAPLDLAWSDWPLRGSFVPLLHRFCRYLAQPAVHAVGYEVGDRAWRRLPGSSVDDRIQVQAPSGRRRFIEANTALGDLRWDVPRLGESGIWSILGPDGSVRDEFAVNVDVAESDLTPWTQEEISVRLGAGRPGAGRVHFLDEGEASRDRVLALRFGRELWRELLVLAGLLLLLELWLARAPVSEAPAQAA